MRIAYVSDLPLPSRSANSLQVMKMCGAFARNGHDLLLLAPPFFDEPGIEDLFHHYGVETRFSLRRVPRYPRPLGEYGYAVLASLIARSGSVDLVYGRSLHACLAASLLGLPVRFEAHELLREARPRRRWLFSRLLGRRRFSHLVVISEALARAYRRHYDIPHQRIIVAPDAADEPRAAELLGFASSERLQVGYVGHLYPGKGMEIIEPLAAACPWADFHIVGGTDSDLGCRHTGSSAASNLLFHGFVPPVETDRFRLSCHVLLAPYQRIVLGAGGGRDIARWMSPLKLFEYMAAGKAILCSDLPVLRELLVDGESALFCPPDDCRAWAAALRRLRDRELRDRLGAAARSRFRERHTWQDRARSVLAGADRPGSTPG